MNNVAVEMEKNGLPAAIVGTQMWPNLSEASPAHSRVAVFQPSLSLDSLLIRHPRESPSLEQLELAQ